MALRRAILGVRPSGGSAVARAWFGTASNPPVTVAERSYVRILQKNPDHHHPRLLPHHPSPLTCFPPPFSRRSIDVTVVIEGVRHKLKGKIGKTLAQALAESNNPTLAGVVPEVSLRQGPDTHVSLPGDVLALMPELTVDETTLLKDIAENPGPISRMASLVVLKKELDGMSVAVAPNRPYPKGAAI